MCWCSADVLSERRKGNNLVGFCATNSNKDRELFVAISRESSGEAKTSSYLKTISHCRNSVDQIWGMAERKRRCLM